jgi:hypothetical protein
METSPIYEALDYREKLRKMPPGFFAFQEEQSKKWKVCFKRFMISKPETIRSCLTEKAAKKKADSPKPSIRIKNGSTILVNKKTAKSRHSPNESRLPLLW